MKSDLIEEAFLAVMNGPDRELALPLTDWAGRNLLRRRIAVALEPLKSRHDEITAERDRLLASIGRIATAMDRDDLASALEAFNDLFAEGLISARQQLERLP
ncbi:hypothetical protein ACLBKU_17520 [Erythrobacter sp. NE805]|uniref:hypothetical protein n=1 Tax=Erythrobacter sp. NE805 TaxID=3389875 RepID=UPI00396AF975